MAQETLGVVVQQGTGGDHFGVEQGVFGEQAQEEPAVAVGPVHHRSYTKSPNCMFLIYMIFLQFMIPGKVPCTAIKCTQGAHEGH